MHAVIFYDDLSKQAVAYQADVAVCCAGRLAARPIPGDVFYLHSAACWSGRQK